MSEDWCDLCELPRGTCIHGRPPTEPAAPVKAARAVRAPAVRRTPRAGSAPRTAAVRRAEVRRTRQAAFRPHILALLQAHDGACDADDLMAELHERMDDVLLDGDHDTLASGEVRWRYTARFERKAMTDDGLMQPARTPGVWELTPDGLAAP